MDVRPPDLPAEFDAAPAGQPIVEQVEVEAAAGDQLQGFGGRRDLAADEAEQAPEHRAGVFVVDAEDAS